MRFWLLFYILLELLHFWSLEYEFGGRGGIMKAQQEGTDMGGIAHTK